MLPTFVIEAGNQIIRRNSRSKVCDLQLEDAAAYASDSLRVVFDDRNFGVALPPIGSELKLYLGYQPEEGHINPKDGMTYMGKFRISSAGAGGGDDGNTVKIEAAGLDFASTLKQTRRKSYHAKTLGQIVRSIARRNGFSDDQIFVKKEYGEIYIFHRDQSESDISFLEKLASDYMCALAVKDGRIVFAPQGEIVIGVPYAPKTFYADRKEFLDWDYETQNRGSYKQVRAKYYDMDKAEQNFVITNPVPDPMALEKDEDTRSIVMLPRTYPTKAEAKAAATSKKVVLDAGRAVFKFTAIGRPDYFPDSKMILSSMKKDMPTEWTIVSVSHSLTNSGYIVSGEAQLPRDPDLYEAQDEGQGASDDSGLTSEEPAL